MKQKYFSSLMLLATLSLTLLLFPLSLRAIEWSGVYRTEGYYINNPELSGANSKKKIYGLHHLVLTPEIIAADSLHIHSRFDIFNNSSQDGISMNNQMGQFFGGGMSNPNRIETAAQNQQSDTLEVSQLYLTLSQEFGSLIVGRAPVSFGLGISHNAGQGLFDHWYDSRDLLGYKIDMGDFSFFPMVAKVGGQGIDRGFNVDLMASIDYKDPDVGMEAGFFYWSRSIPQRNNDANGAVVGEDLNPPANNGDNGDSSSAHPGYGVGSIGSNYSMTQFNFYFSHTTNDFTISFEGAKQTGYTGVLDERTGEGVDLSGQGLAIELDWKPEKKGFRWKGGVNLGYASGDDPKTSLYEGFIFDPNYDVALLMFNQPLGLADYFRSSVSTGRTDFSNMEVADVEAISNIMYFSPHIDFNILDNLELQARLTTGWLNEHPLDTSTSSSLGYELDLSLNFTNQHISWSNGLGLLFPGAAFEATKDGSRSTGMAFGVTSRLAIRF